MNSILFDGNAGKKARLTFIPIANAGEIDMEGLYTH